MSYTKRQFVVAAFEEIGLASYTFDLTPEQLESACRRLDTMMARWNAVGVRLGYPLPSSPEDTDLDTETGVPDASNEAIICNLAIRIAPGYGKVVSADTKVIAKQSYDLLLSKAAVPPELQLPSQMPSGAGNKPWRVDEPFLPDPVDPLSVGPDSVLNLS